MLLGLISGAIIGVIYYMRRSGGNLFAADMQTGKQTVVIQALRLAVVPAVIGALIGWVIL